MIGEPIENSNRRVWDNTHLQWLAVELTSGLPIAELPDLQVNTLSIRMEEISESTAYLPYDNAPVNWMDATEPYKVALLLVRDSIVLWGGIVLQRSRDIAAGSVELKLATVEHFLDSVFIVDANYKQIEQTQIIQNLIGMTSNHRFPLDCTVYASSYRRDRNYTADQDKTILSAIQELGNVINGPEWYSYWALGSDGMTYRPVIITADHLGALTPSTTFDSSVMISFNVLEDYTTGFGANRVQASSTAEGETKPTSSWHSSADSSRPIIEYKYTPSSSIVNIPVLEQHAEQKLKELQNGTTTITFSASLLDAPKLGIDWHLGDVVSFDVSDDIRQYPDYGHGNLRVIGYDIDFQGAWKLTPVLRPIEQAGA